MRTRKVAANHVIIEGAGQVDTATLMNATLSALTGATREVGAHVEFPRIGDEGIDRERITEWEKTPLGRVVDGVMKQLEAQRSDVFCMIDGRPTSCTADRYVLHVDVGLPAKK